MDTNFFFAAGGVTINRQDVSTCAINRYARVYDQFAGGKHNNA